MKRSRLGKFLIPSVVVHVILIAFILVYFVDSDAGRKSGSIIVGIVGSEDTGSARPKPEKSETAKLQESVKNNVKQTAVKQKSPGEPEKKELTTAKAVERSPSAAVNRNIQTGEKKQALTDEENSATSANQGPDRNKGLQTAGNETAAIEKKGESGEAATNPVTSAGVKKSARPDYKINPAPRYPATARRRGYEGEVHLRVYVLENGRVGKIELAKPSGYEVLDETALEAVKSWVFIPGTEDGREVASWVTVPISFRLDKG
ncbi:MAG: energy transducer TonB [Deltaproteobacteria bacterium]